MESQKAKMNSEVPSQHSVIFFSHFWEDYLGQDTFCLYVNNDVKFMALLQCSLKTRSEFQSLMRVPIRLFSLEFYDLVLVGSQGKELAFYSLPRDSLAQSFLNYVRWL